MAEEKPRVSAHTSFSQGQCMASGWGVTLALDPQQKGHRTTMQRNG